MKFIIIISKKIFEVKFEKEQNPLIDLEITIIKKLKYSKKAHSSNNF